MSISTKTIQIGADFVKEFGKLGEEGYRKVHTRTQNDGTILTRVFDSENRLLTERSKKVGKIVKDDEEFLITTKKVVKDKDGILSMHSRGRAYDKALAEAQFADMAKAKYLRKVVAEQYKDAGIEVKESELLGIGSRPCLKTKENNMLDQLYKRINGRKVIKNIYKQDVNQNENPQMLSNWQSWINH